MTLQPLQPKRVAPQQHEYGFVAYGLSLEQYSEITSYAQDIIDRTQSVERTVAIGTPLLSQRRFALCDALGLGPNAPLRFQIIQYGNWGFFDVSNNGNVRWFFLDHDILLDYHAKAVYKWGSETWQPIPFTELRWCVFSHIIDKAGGPSTTREILRSCWDPNEFEKGLVRWHVTRIRRDLWTNKEEARYRIYSNDRLGYRYRAKYLED